MLEGHSRSVDIGRSEVFIQYRATVLALARCDCSCRLCLPFVDACSILVLGCPRLVSGSSCVFFDSILDGVIRTNGGIHLFPSYTYSVSTPSATKSMILSNSCDYESLRLSECRLTRQSRSCLLRNTRRGPRLTPQRVTTSRPGTKSARGTCFVGSDSRRESRI